jgi:hypothetical protein
LKHVILKMLFVGGGGLASCVQAAEMECLLMMTPGVPISKLAFDTEAEKPIHTTIYDPANPSQIKYESSPHIAAAIHTPAIQPNQFGVGGKGPSSLYVATNKPGESPRRPVIYHVEWEQGTMHQVHSHVQHPHIEIADEWECEVTEK